MRKYVLTILGALCYTLLLQAQQPDTLPPGSIPVKYMEQVAGKARGLGEKLDKKSAKALANWQKQEAKLQRQLAKMDSSAAAKLFSDAKEKFGQLQDKLQHPDKLQSYIPHLDSLGTSLNFLSQNNQLLAQAAAAKDKLKDAIGKVEALKAQLQKADDIKKFLKERKQYLKEQLAKFGFAKQLKKLNKQVYYYTQQVNEYKAMLHDPKKAEAKALELLSRTKLFKDFMQKNSMLASLFRMPGDPNDPSAQASLAGLQTRAQVNNLIQQQIASGGPNAQAQFQQNLQAAQSQLNQLKDKILKTGGGSSEAEMPEGFKPNDQKTKSFLQRWQLGTNMQSQKGNGLLPVTSDIGLSAGYKLNDKSIIGIGGSFKLGWGRDIQHISLSGQGASLRSFVDWKLKGSLWISGGFEMNYRNAFYSIPALQNYAAWQQSGLLGLSRSIPIKTKFFTNTKLQLLWDFLSYQQVPRTQALVFRVGYNLK